MMKSTYPFVDRRDEPGYDYKRRAAAYGMHLAFLKEEDFRAILFENNPVSRVRRIESLRKIWEGNNVLYQFNRKRRIAAAR